MYYIIENIGKEIKTKKLKFWVEKSNNKEEKLTRKD